MQLLFEMIPFSLSVGPGHRPGPAPGGRGLTRPGIGNPSAPADVPMPPASGAASESYDTGMPPAAAHGARITESRVKLMCVT